MCAKLKMVGFLLIGSVLLVPNLAAFAREKASVQPEIPISKEAVSFHAWKTRKIVDAKNELARAINRLVIYQHEHAANGEKIKSDIQAGKVEKRQELTPRLEIRSFVAGSQLTKYEMDVVRLQKNLEFAKELTLQDYVVGYLSRFNNDPHALSAMAGHLTDAQIAELLKALLSTSASSLSPARAAALAAKNPPMITTGEQADSENQPPL